MICNKCRMFINNKKMQKKNKQIVSSENCGVEEVSGCNFELNWDTSMITGSPSISNSDSEIESNYSVNIMNTSEAVDHLNSCLEILQNSPIKKNKLNQKKYPEIKSEKVCTSIKKKIFSVSETPRNEKTNLTLLEKLKAKFKETDDYEKKIEILTLFSDMSRSEIKKHFEATNHMIEIAKNVCAEKGVLSHPSNFIERKRIKDSDIKLVKDDPNASIKNTVI